MTRHDINLAIETYCDECGGGLTCSNNKCHLWGCRTSDLSEGQTIEVISDSVMYHCQTCLQYLGYCNDECFLSEIPT